MRKLLSVISLLIISSIYSFAFAANYNVYGKIKNKNNNEPLAYATVAILTEDKSEVVGGSISNELGEFTIKNIPSGTYTFQVSFIGYKTHHSIIKVEKNNKNVGEILLEKEEEALKGVEIVARRPVIEQKIDKLVMNVADNIDTQNATAEDVIKRAPGIVVDQDGNVTLNGMAVEVWIDNRPSHMSGTELEALLQATDGSLIDKIEIISNPSSKYDASGSGGIINIISKKNALEGFNGSINGGYNGAFYKEYYQGGNLNISLNYRTKKVNTIFNYGGRINNGFRETNQYSVTPFQKMDNHSKRLSNRFFQNFKLTQDFYLNERNVIGYIVRGGFRKGKNTSTDDSYNKVYDINDNLLFSNISDLENKNKGYNVFANLNYTHYFNDEKTSNLTLSTDYRNHCRNSFNKQHNLFLDSLENNVKPPYAFNDIQNVKFHVVTSEADFTHRFGDKSSFEAGAKYTYATTDNSLDREELFNDIWVLDSTYQNIFQYNEQVLAGYASYGIMFNPKISLKAGIRAEQTFSKGDWLSSDTITTKQYFDIFPTLYLGYNPNENFRYGISYTRRINRPRYSQLNPFRRYSNNMFFASEGNPDLTPSFSNNIFVNFGYKQYFNVGLMYFNSSNMITEDTKYDPETGMRISFSTNNGKMHMLGASISLTELPITEWYTININLFGSHNTTILKDTTNKSYSGNLYFSNTFYLPKDIKIDLGGWGTSGGNFGYFKMKPMFNAYLGIKKDFLDKKATISLNVRDLFRTGKHSMTITKGENDYVQSSFYRNSQVVSLGFTYKFGQMKSYQDRRLRIDDDSRMEDNGNGIPSTPGMN